VCSIGNFGTQLTIPTCITTLHGLGREQHFREYSYCFVFTDPLLRNGFFYCCVRVHFRGNLVTEPLPNNELFRLSDVMSYYFTERVWAALTVKPRIRKVLSSNLGRNGYFHGYFEPLNENVWIVPRFRPRPLPSKFFPICCLLTNLPFSSNDSQCRRIN
jgi:hypothetical protein